MLLLPRIWVLLKQYGPIPRLPIHLSTQASCLNAYGAKFWKEAQVSRIILGRESSIEEAKRIKDEADIEVEMFVHGALCSAYSGKCVISNFTRGRDSNRGGCAHSCRFEYQLEKQDSKQKTQAFFMSSKDLQGPELLEKFIDCGIDSLKIEGRMKSLHYVGTTSKIYSGLLKHYKKYGTLPEEHLLYAERELSKVTSRDKTTASLTRPS